MLSCRYRIFSRLRNRSLTGAEDADGEAVREMWDDGEARRRFAEQEITYLDGSAGRRTADFVLSLLELDDNR